MKAVIRITGNWCDGYWWEIVNSDTGRTIKSDGPYHASRLEDAKQVACEDAADYASRNSIEVVRRP